MLGEAYVADWQAAGLLKPSAIKPVITTIEQALVIRRLGQLTTEDQQVLRSAIARIVG
jgi:mRNA interferase MazF